MESITLQQLIEMGGDTPMLILMTYFLWKLDRAFAVLATQIKTALAMLVDDAD